MKNIKPYYAIINRVPILFMLLLICSHKRAVGAESDYLTLPMPQKFIPALQADGKPWGAIPADGKKRIYLIGMTEKEDLCMIFILGSPSALINFLTLSL